MKKVVIIVVSIAILLLGILLTLFFTGETFQLRESTLTSSEKKIIKKHFNKEEIDFLLENQCDSFIVNLAEEKDFSKDSLKEYCQYYKKNEEANIDILYIVNMNISDLPYTDSLKTIIHSENINPSNLRRYLNFSEKNPTLNIPDVITLVNLDYDKVANPSEDLKNFFLDPYFISDNLEKYLSYKQGHADTPHSMVVALINSNRYYDFYTNVQNADLSKKEKVLVNKYNILEEKYIPSLVTIDENYTTKSVRSTKEAAEAFIKLSTQAKKEHMTILASSGYRSYESQKYIYDTSLRDKGADWTNLNEARPGFSEYQTGLMIDFIHGKSEDAQTFQNSREFEWLKKHAHEYGFILRYPEGKENITGFSYNPCRFRYVGKKVAKMILEENITFEEYYNYYEK